MDETLMGPLSGYALMALALAVAGAARLVRAYVAHRTRLHEEREASTRTAARVSGMIRLAEANHHVVRITERDRDGHRDMELGGRLVPGCHDSKEAA